MTRDAIRAFFADRQVEWKRRDADALAKGYVEDCEVYSPMFGSLKGRPAVGERPGSGLAAHSGTPEGSTTADEATADARPGAPLRLSPPSSWTRSAPRT